jgi:hypothetical protein
VGGSLKELKSKKNMTVVRKKAMRSYLANNKDGDVRKKSTVSEEARHPSVDSSGSRSSIGSRGPVIANDVSTNLDDGISVVSRTQSSQALAATLQQTQRAPVPESQTSALLSMTQAFEATTLIELPRPYDDDGRELPYVRNPYPLFVSFGQNVDPFKTMFQSSYPRVSVEQMKFLCARFFGTKAMGRHWIPTVLSAPHTFLSTLCCASAHLDAILDRATESVETSLLRQEVIHLISQNMLHPDRKVDELNITSTIQLIVCEIIGREEISLKINENGIEQMILLRGGLNHLHMNGYLASTCSWVLLESAILREERPKQMFVDYCMSRSNMTQDTSAVIPESPLCRPRKRFVTLKKSRYYQQGTLELLDEVHSMIELFLQTPTPSRRNSRNLLSHYQKITTKYPSMPQAQTASQDDYKYEAIRIAAILLATAFIKGMSLSKALPHAAEMVLASPFSFERPSQSSNPPTSPLSPMNTRSDALTEYAASLDFPPPNSYFDGSRTSISSVTNSHPSVSSSISYPSFSSSATAHSSVASIPETYPPTELSKSSLRLLSTRSTPEAGDPFAEHIPAPKRTGSTDLLERLKVVLNASNLSEAWQDMAGVLLWIGLVFGAASHKVGNRALEKWYSALSMRASTLLSFQYPEPIHATMLKMTQIVNALRELDSTRTVGPT